MGGGSWLLPRIVGRMVVGLQIASRRVQMGTCHDADQHLTSSVFVPPCCSNHEIEQLLALDNTTMLAAAARYPYPQVCVWRVPLSALGCRACCRSCRHRRRRRRKHCFSQGKLPNFLFPLQDPAKIDTRPNVGAYYLEQFGTNFASTSGHGCALAIIA